MLAAASFALTPLELSLIADRKHDAKSVAPRSEIQITAIDQETAP